MRDAYFSSEMEHEPRITEKGQSAEYMDHTDFGKIICEKNAPV